MVEPPRVCRRGGEDTTSQSDPLLRPIVTNNGVVEKSMRFPQTRNFTGLFAPSGVEAEVRNLPVIEGEIPGDLDGVFYRVAPDPQLPPLAGDDIWFNGDGMVTAIDFRKGEVGLRQRWVRTEKFVL